MGMMRLNDCILAPTSPRVLKFHHLLGASQGGLRTQPKDAPLMRAWFVVRNKTRVGPASSRSGFRMRAYSPRCVNNPASLLRTKLSATRLSISQ